MGLVSVVNTRCMKKQKEKTTNKKWIAISLICGLLVQGCGKAGQGSVSTGTSSDGVVEGATDEPPYFEEVSSAAALPAEDDVTPVRVRAVKANVEALKQSLRSGRKTIRLDLFKDKNITVKVEDLQILSKDNLIVTGQIIGKQLSSVSLVIRDDVVMANIHDAGNNRYSIEYSSDGTHTVEEVKDEAKDDCLTVDEGSGSSAAALGEGSGSDPVNMAETISGQKIIDMLVAYTPAARAKVGGTTAMLAKIQMGIADTNKAFTASSVNLQVRLAGTMEVSQNETGNFSSDLSALKGKTDGRWDEVHAKRMAVGADQVTMVGVYSGQTTAGIGYIKATAASAFTVVKVSAFSIYTFSHELGHNIGLQHSDGYVNSSGGFRTIMAYGSVPRILRYSNPSLLYSGYKTGDSSHNSSAKLNLYGGTTAAFYATKFSSSTSLSAADFENGL